MAKSSHKIRLHAAPDHVHQALTTQVGLQSWFTPHVEDQVSEGHKVKMSFGGKEPFRWRMSSFKPATRMHWECLEGPGSVKGTSVTCTLSNQGGQTVLECDHDGWPKGHEAFATCNTLWGILMRRLKEYAETGTANPAFT